MRLVSKSGEEMRDVKLQKIAEWQDRTDKPEDLHMFDSWLLKEGGVS